MKVPKWLRRKPEWLTHEDLAKMKVKPWKVRPDCFGEHDMNVKNCKECVWGVRLKCIDGKHHGE